MKGLDCIAAVASDSEERLASDVPRSGGAVDFDRIYQMYGRRVYWWCARMVGDNAEAEDLTQDSFLQLFRSIHSFRGESAFATWLHRVVVTVVLGRIRKKTLPTVSWDGDSQGDADELRQRGSGASLQGTSSNPLDRIGLQQAMVQLPPTFRSILLLHDVQGYRHFEISRILGVPVGTSKSYLHRARLQMRRLLREGQSAPPMGSTRRPRRRKLRDHLAEDSRLARPTLSA